MSKRDYVMELAKLDLVAKMHLPDIMDVVRRRRAELGEALACLDEAFNADTFGAAVPAFRRAINSIQDLQTETIRRLELGQDGIETVVRNHKRTEEWAVERLEKVEKKIERSY